MSRASGMAKQASNRPQSLLKRQLNCGPCPLRSRPILPQRILLVRNGNGAMIDPRPTLEAPDDDPYLWLEEVDGERALAWVEAQNSTTLARFGDARFAADRDTLAAIFDRP